MKAALKLKNASPPQREKRNEQPSNRRLLRWGKVEAPWVFRCNGAFGGPCRAQMLCNGPFGSGAQKTEKVPSSPGQPPDAVAPKPKGRCRQVGLHLVEPEATHQPNNTQTRCNVHNNPSQKESTCTNGKKKITIVAKIVF